MGYFSDYLGQKLSMDGLESERKKQLSHISKLRGGRDILVYAADLSKGIPDVTICYSDLLSVHDQVSNLKGKSVDLILETPGGSGQVAEDIVRILRYQYENVSVIVPGAAKSAGTIIAMSADEILMEPSLSSLGPIDAQLSWQGKVFSAHALLKGFKKIKKEVAENQNNLNKAYIPILQAISPGELENARNALKFAEELVEEWLVEYKFSNWDIHSSTGEPVTEKEKKNRASEIAALLCNHSNWRSHGKSIKLDDLEKMRLKITDYSQQQELAEAIQRYYALMQMTFSSSIYKIFETVGSHIYKMQQDGSNKGQQAEVHMIDLECNNCKHSMKLQANLTPGTKALPNAILFPENNHIKCPNCKADLNLTDLRDQIEKQTGKNIVI